MKNSVSLVGALLLLAACGSVPTNAPEPAPNVRAGTPIPLSNPSFNPDARGRMTDWMAGQHAGDESYSFTADPVNAHSAPASARIHRHGIQHYGLLEQGMRMKPEWRGKTLRLSGWLKCENIEGIGGAMSLRVDGGQGQMLAINSMDDARLKGTQPWKLYRIELKTPPDAAYLRIGMLLEEGGSGTLWADDFVLELLD